jgi:intron-binding protein aquarius
MFAETSRTVAPPGEEMKEVTGQAQMQDLEHLGRYVFEMSKAKVEALKANGGVLPTRSREVEMIKDGGVEGDEEEVDDRPENVLLPEEVGEVDGEEEDEDEDVKV